ncbi:hypothetical protein M0805_008651 [Coniferiporia weirii]|nr:hypothetical protein M0805_008651 [Coniferiporia weirii]
MSRKKTSVTSKATAAPVNGSARVVQAAASVVALSLVVFVAQELLIPLFGGVATKLYLQSGVISLVVSFAFLPYDSTFGEKQTTILSTIVCIAPPILHWLSTLTTRLGNPVIGPIFAYVPVLAPVVYMATGEVRNATKGKSHTLKAFSAIALSTVVLQSQRIWSYVPFSRIFNQSMFLLISGWLVAASSLLTRIESSATQKSRKSYLSPFILPFFATIFTLSLAPTRPHSLPYSHPNGLLRILSSTPSITGRIVVGEDYTHGFRFLRADHSLLGGVWVGTRHLAKMDRDAEYVRDSNGVKLGDSIYSAFVLQEAARLQERETPQKDALIIGLGVGIAAQAFIQHGLSATIVEIDPAVYSAARTYFGVPEPAAAYIEDARGWVARRAALNNETYDIVVHDCFSGGGVPAHLFTSEFWEDLKKIVSPEGIVAVNYAGMIGSDSSRSVFLTLKKSFGHCRIFHDYQIDVPDEKLTAEFINLVFFCTPSSNPLTFRPLSRPDYLSSYLREHVLRVLPDREVRADLITREVPPESEAEWVLTDARNPLGAWQDEGALDHWKVMRNVLPDYVWATY